DKRFWGPETGLDQRFAALIQPGGNFLEGITLKFKIVMMQAMLNDVEAGISAQILDQLLIGSNGNTSLSCPVSIGQKSLGTAIGQFGLSGNIRNRGEIH